MNINSGTAKLMLMSPAWNNWGAANTVRPDTVILHSRVDDVIPFTDSEELIKNNGLPESALIEVGIAHRLADQESLERMLEACTHDRPEERIDVGSILDHQAVSGCYLFPQPRCIDAPFTVQVTGAELNCYRRIVNPANFTMVHFHGNGEAVADYIPWLADVFATHGLNSLFVEYRQYGGSTGKAQLAAMLGDGEAAMAAAGIAPERAIALGRSIGSLYAIELAYRQPTIAGLVLESSIADPSERFLVYADLSASGFTEADVVVEAKQKFSHQQKLSAYHNPLLVMHTEHDGLIDISHAERNFDWAASSQKRLLRFSVGNHNTILGYNREEYVNALREFVNTVAQS